jgi:hypothetical protein
MKLSAIDWTSQRKHPLDLHWKLLILTIAAFPFFAAQASALPTVIAYGHFTDHLAQSPIPSFEVGEKVQIFAVLDSTDPVRSPTISVEAVQGAKTEALPQPPNDDPIFQGQHLYSKFIDFEPTLTGPWEIIPTDSTGIGPSTFTNAIVEPEHLPFVENITLGGTPIGDRVTWTLPNLDGFDVDGVFVGIVEAPSGSQVWGSDLLPVHTTSLDIPAGVLEVGVDYVYGVQLGDLEGGRAENVSRAFTRAFRYTLPGDFNTDGTVDAADYVVWRKDYSNDQAMYDAWRANFGVSLGTGSGSTGYPLGASAEPLSAAVPEPAGAWLLLIGIALCCWIVPRDAATVPAIHTTSWPASSEPALDCLSSAIIGRTWHTNCRMADAHVDDRRYADPGSD